MYRPATIERVPVPGRRATSLAETSPYRRATASSLDTADDVAPAEFGAYLVYEQLGEGGMAYVHRAEHVATSGLRKQVALKRMRTDSAEDPSLVTSFVHEAQIAAKLRHPNIAQAYELGKIDNTYYIAMEFVPGPTLAQVIAQSQQGAGAVPLAIALELLIQIADALDHAHDLRDDAGQPLDLIHRDVSPGNIIISRTGQAKLIDFGIAKVRSARHSTEAGYIKGKHGYVAPEYTYGQLDRRADLFALGIVAHEVLTGRRLFLADTDLETLGNVRHMAVPPPSRLRSSISAELDAIVLRALDRDPDTRWQSAGEVRDALVTEARRLGMAISGPQIRDWVEWAFQQMPRRDSSIDRLTNGLEPSISIEISVEAAAVAAEQKLIETVVFTPPVIVSPRAASPGPATVAPRAASPSPAAVVDGGHAVARIALRAATQSPPVIAPPVIAPPVISPPIFARAATAQKLQRSQRRRAPQWRAPTRWARPAPARTVPKMMILLALIAFALFAVDQNWIDIERWRQILGV